MLEEFLEICHQIGLMNQNAISSTTPMLRQYLEIKEKHRDAILLYRIGDFYEMFFEDAVTASKELDIVLTSRNKNDPNPVPLCGVPYHSVQPYIEKLVARGHRVAICDQVEDPKEAKGVVRREVSRVITPGLSGLLETPAKGSGQGAPYLAVIHFGKETCGLALLEIATGDFRVTEMRHPEGRFKDLLREEIDRIHPREIVVSAQWNDEKSGLKEEYKDLLPPDCCLSLLPEWIWDETYARRTLYDQFQVSTLSGFNCEEIPSGIIAAGAALYYVKDTQRVARLPHVTALKRYHRSETMLLSEDSRKNLSFDDLIACLDQTRTAAGKRRLREWFYAPLLQKAEIEKRLDVVAELKEREVLCEKIQKGLESVYDLERINSRLSLGAANARDLKGLAQTLLALHHISPFLTEFCAEELKEISQSWNSFLDLREVLDKTLVEEPPLALKEGELIAEGVSAELDELRRLRRDAKSSMAAMEERERKRTGIGSLKIHFNRVFGYYLEVYSAHLSKVPPDFIRKQTLANSERYITPELKEFEDKVLGAEERIKALEYELFCELRQKALREVPGLQAQAGRVATLDAFLSLASYARENRTVRPVIEENGFLKIRVGRHPLVEKSISAGSYVPNDLSMDVDGDRFLMITGPNMAGKSTVIRQTGVIVLMAQTGSFVPAQEACIGIVDQIFTRVGAADRLARGESTFMVEMCETASILHHATEKSLVLLDEIGRGTSTFDGISIAWAVAEYLHDTVRARTLFATHYHELIDLALTRSGIKNYNVQVKEEGNQITFLYRLVEGGMSHSFGIHVARLAGLPTPVLERAKEVLKNLEQGELDPGGVPRLGKKQKKNNSNQGDLF